MIKEQFQFILDNYNDGERKVSSASPVYDALINVIPLLLKQEFIRRKDLYFKGSVGQGNKTEYPWLCVFNTNITRNARYGLYIVYLFKKDMSGFYLTLNQGFTYFDEMYRSKKYDAIKKCVDYFKEKIETDMFSKHPIDLGAKSKSLGYGYQATTIVSKFYKTHEFTDDELLSDLKDLLKIYDDIYNHMDTDSYKDIIARIVSYKSTILEQKITADVAIDSIQTVLDEVDGQPFNFSKTIREVEPFVNTSNKFREITNPQIKKTDWVKRAKQDALTGLHGEGYAILFEKERLERIGLGEYVDKISQVSIKSDGYGYDIESYDLIGVEIKKIYIEVKTTSNKVDVEFQVSRGEVEKSKELKNCYFIYRVYDLKHDPKIYRVQGAIPDHFELDPITYLARYKG